MVWTRNEIRWAPRVSRDLIVRLYESHAAGDLDAELLDEVAYALYARCKHILVATEAALGRVACPCCEETIRRDASAPESALLICGRCGWRLTWAEYQDSYQRRQLHGGGAVPYFDEYVRRLPQATTSTEKMLLVDWLIHRCHRNLREEYLRRRPHAATSRQRRLLLDRLIRRWHEELRDAPAPGSYTRPAAINLIDGSMTSVIDLLEYLASLPAGAGRAPEHYREWRARVMSGLPGRNRRKEGCA